MTLLGKIMTFVVLMISTAVGVAGLMVYASHRNWKSMAQELKAEYEEEKQIREQAQVRISFLQKQLEKEKVSLFLTAFEVAELRKNNEKQETLFAARGKKKEEIKGLNALLFFLLLSVGRRLGRQ